MVEEDDNWPLKEGSRKQAKGLRLRTKTPPLSNFPSDAGSDNGILKKDVGFHLILWCLVMKPSGLFNLQTCCFLCFDMQICISGGVKGRRSSIWEYTLRLLQGK